ncbi:MAG: fumarate hydratase C-terminal domain-containing protein [Lentisphaerae bacterium]|nr:fumarate hydratase C-terminal domain-containing protein [Lentisphaerota bacterium]
MTAQPVEMELETPLTAEQVTALPLGGTVWLSGTIFGLRDATLRRMFDEGAPLPEPLAGYPCLHTAPNARKVDGRYEKICIGTTTSARMERFTRPLLRDAGARAIIGKGGLGDDSLAAMQEYGAVYLAIVGGAAALQTTQIVSIDAVYWEDLFPECLWRFTVKRLGPLIVGMDAHGGNLYAEVAAAAQARAAAAGV